MSSIHRPRRAWLALLALPTLAMACSSPPETANDVLEAAISARYGHVIQSVPDGAVIRSTGKFFGLPATRTTTFLHPNQLRIAMEIDEIDGEVIDRIFDGKSFFTPTSTRPNLMTPTEARAFLQEAFDANSFWLVGLRDPNMTLVRVPSSPDEDPDPSAPITLEVAHKNGYLRHLHFDAETYDLIAMEGVATTEFGRRPIRTEFSDFASIDGVRIPRRTVYTIRDNVAWEGTLESARFDDLPTAESLLLRSFIVAE